jgi:hypothetical protein
MVSLFWAADELTGSPIVDQAATMDRPKALLLKHLWIYATTRDATRRSM